MKLFWKMGFAAFVALASTNGIAGSDSAQALNSESAAKTGITKEEATATALKLVPGKVIEIEREKHKGEPVYSVEIRGADGVHEVAIRIADGAVVDNQAKGNDDDDDGEENE